MDFLADIEDIGLRVDPAAEKVGASEEEINKRLDRASKETNTKLTETQKETGRYRKGRLYLHGLRVALENPKGSIRSGVGANGKKWSTKMQSHYGYIEGTDGRDGDAVDVFIGDEPHSEYVLVINQVDPKTKRFDEHKAMLGYASRRGAERCYLSNYEEGWQGMGKTTPMTMDQFKKWLKDGNQNKPAPELKAAEDDDDGSDLSSDEEHVPTVAIDLDGTLARHYERYDPDSIPEPRPGARFSVEQFRRDGYRIIINTVRGDRGLVRRWLVKHSIPFDYINENPDQPEGSSDKIYADVYVDDRAVDARKSWKQIRQEVGKRVKAAEGEEVISGNGRSLFPGRGLPSGECDGQALSGGGILFEEERYD
jgi:hypothetical protein